MISCLGCRSRRASCSRLFQDILQSLLSYLDRAFISKDPKRRNIRSVDEFLLCVLVTAHIPYPSDLAFTSFQRQILNDAPIVDSIRASVLEWLNWERNEGLVSRLLSLLTHSPDIGLHILIATRFGILSRISLCMTRMLSSLSAIFLNRRHRLIPPKARTRKTTETWCEVVFGSCHRAHR